MDKVKRYLDESIPHAARARSNHTRGARAANLPRTANTNVVIVPRQLLRAIGVVGVAMTVPVVAWLLPGGLDSVPSMIDVFGIAGLRIPASASVTVCGSLMAAIGFHKD